MSGLTAWIIGKRGTGWILACLCLVIALARLHTYHEPTDRDLGGYAVIAHEMLQGRRIYTGVLLDQKPPGIHVTYALAELFAGYGRGEIYLLGVAAAVATLFGFYLTGKNIGGNRSAGLWAAAFWTVTSGDLWLQANQPNCEAFINAWTVFGLLFLLGRRQGFASSIQTISPMPPISPMTMGCPYKIAPSFLAGLCFALASFYKHVVVVIPLFVGLAYILFPPPERTRRQAACDIAIVGLVGLLAWATLLGYFGITGRFQNLYNSLFKYNIYYSSKESVNPIKPTGIEQIIPVVLCGLLPLVILAMTGTITAIYRRKFFPWIVLAGLAVGTGLAVALPGKFYPHYYQLWYPFLILGSALTAGWIGQTGARFKLARLLPPLALIALLANEVPSYFLSAREWSREKYGPIFVQTNDLARDIRGWLKPGETMFQLGEEPQLYFDTCRRPTSTICIYGVFTGPLAPYLSWRTFKDLYDHPPDLLVMDAWAYAIIMDKSAYLSSHNDNNPLWPWIREHYSHPPNGADQDMLIVCVRNGSDLQKRLASDHH